ncbi:MAG: Gfo/Idh/MocA family oxidoreductase [Spirochaetes bacterium]|nr:Gfo/Idh/MocA family oxidoreductase [Spirochaetota bacterium]
MHKDNQVAVLGAGYWGKNLVRNFYEIGVLHSVCDSNKFALEKMKEQYRSVEITTDYQDILDNKDIKGIVISSPAESHYKFAKQALEAGKHVYVEKPLTIQLNEAEELVRMADDKNLILMVGHLLQYHPVFVKLREIVKSGELGKIYYIYSNRLNLGKIRNEENILWSFAPHDISMILSLSGEEPFSVHAEGGYYLQDKIADVTITHFDFPCGIKSHIFVSWLHPYKEQKLVVVGEKKMAVFSDTEDWENKLLVYPHSIEWDNHIPVPQKADSEKVPVEQSEPLRNECLHFLECMQTGKKPVTDGEEGLRVLKVLNRAQESLDNRSGRK